MTTKEIHDYIRAAMSQRKGDNLERANRAFGHMTEAQLDLEWGTSGNSARKIWQEYKDYRAKHDEAAAYLERLFTVAGPK